ncbi:MFS family protein [Capsaspora owczarzaki ATCC 30864]|uniref:MFS family protein n=1 Tax=Capsaspora owczarzaki (strain ATCC 30864) TaxID=595528 RepID=A0A0D2U952_CAPO3|nr:MFS family protein [Capsaspora owczarzaki ATCC 30864]KJE91576.1 MFS family protein [Capsaspora owczarzaki ATCC 30864]|eukprot:XP_004349451.1 MFS family protein [Capsaspora owczarzaki ATCC 30864]
MTETPTCDSVDVQVDASQRALPPPPPPPPPQPQSACGQLLVVVKQLTALFHESSAGSLYTLFLMFMAFSVSNLCMYVVPQVSQVLEQDLHFGDGQGGGVEYYVLAGSVFVVIFTIAGIPMGILGDRYDRRRMLAVAVASWSAITMASAACQAYWQLVLCRVGVAIAMAACAPFAASILADRFVQNRSAAMSVFYWGIYFGYSASYAVGNLLSEPIGWRWSFVVAGSPGLILAALIAWTIHEPVRGEAERAPAAQPRLHRAASSEKDQEESALLGNDYGYQTLSDNPPVPQQLNRGQDTGVYTVRESLIRFCTSKPALVLCAAGAVRNSAGYVWSFNTNLFYKNVRHLSPDQIAAWMSWTPLVSGSIGTMLGGALADWFGLRYGGRSRVWLLVASQVLATPLAAGALWLDYPWCFVVQLPANIFSEMWMGVTMALVVDLFPIRMRSFAVALYFFIIQNIGGNATVLVDPLQYNAGLGLQDALLVLFPGTYLLSAVLFALAYWPLKQEDGRRQSDTRPLLSS